MIAGDHARSGRRAASIDEPAAGIRTLLTAVTEPMLPEAVPLHILLALRELFHVDIAILFAAGEDVLQMVGSVDGIEPGALVAASESWAVPALQTGAPVSLVTSEDSVANQRLQQVGIAAAAWAPARGSPRPNVVVGVFRFTPDGFRDSELALIAAAADRIGAALETGRLYRSIADATTQRSRAEETLRSSEERLAALVGSSSDVITIVGADAKYRYISPAAQPEWGFTPATLYGTNIFSRVHPDDLASARSILADADQHPEGTFTTSLRVQHRDGSWRRFQLLVTNRQADAAVAGTIATYRDITERGSFEDELTRLAFRDPLTDLPNRALFTDRLKGALARSDRHGAPVALLFVDLDNFKVINDSLGHEWGDHVLVSIADRLRACIRVEDTAARWGGDEFTVILEDVRNEASAIDVADRIAEVLKEPLEHKGRSVYVSASVGIALSGPGVSRAEDLLRNADLAMYHAKAGGKARHASFEPGMEMQAVSRLDLETDLRHALERNEFEIYYQPIVALDTSRLVEVEALVRWVHPERGLLLPLSFIPLAEETGLVVQIGHLVLLEACKQVRAWQERYPTDPPLILNVNVSPRQFHNPNLIDDVAHILSSVDFNPSHLRLEITESVVMENAETSKTTLHRLKDLGVQLAIDDFGTGYSSLSYLKQFPVDTLKIDRCFVEDLERDRFDAAIIRSVVALAKALNLKVTGEGIETPAQQHRLHDLGCHLGQGYLFALPQPALEMEGLIARGSIGPALSAA